jgi:hypothetical protein
VALAQGALLAACGGEANPGVSAKMNLAEGAGFFEAPFPIDHRDLGDGRLAVADFPSGGNPLLEQLVAMIESGEDGFSPNAAIYLPFEGKIDAGRLPATPAASLEPASAVYLVNVDRESDEYGARVPIEASFKAEPETYTPANVLVALPFQGAVMAPKTVYALVVRRALGDDQGRALFTPEPLEALLRGDAPAGPHGARLQAAFAPLVAWLGEQGIPAADVGAATVFRTGDPLGAMQRFSAQIAAAPPPAATSIAAVETHDEYCVVSASVPLPVFQRGPKPYAEWPSGQLVVNHVGELEEQERDQVTVLLTVPHGIMPPDGYPLVIYAAGAEGTARQVIDRTAVAADPDAGKGPRGQGPAKHYAARGVAALGFPAPLAWERHPDNQGGLLDFWNVGNLGAFRDNIRQGILDIATLVALVPSLSIDAALCPEASADGGVFRFDPDRVVLHGHSTGSTIGSAAIALEPGIVAGVLSGAGGSWIYNVAMARSPVDLATFAHALLGYADADAVDIFDPALTLFQTALESIEVMDWGRATIKQPLPGRRPKHLLLIEGVVDTYHFPRMVNAYAMSVGTDLISPEVEPTAAEEYPLVGRGVVPPPVSLNVPAVGGSVTAATLQRAQNGEDGHYVPFEFDDVKRRYACFVATLADGDLPIIPAIASDPFAPCD